MAHDVSYGGRNLIALLLGCTALIASPAGAQDKKTAPAKPQRQLSLQNEPWTGDFDRMLERRVIRVLAPYSRTLYYVDKARERAARPVPSEAHVHHAIDDADRQIGVARSVISGHRGWIGADARTRLAEAERVRGDLVRYAGPIDEDDRDEAMSLARISSTS